MHSLKNRGPWYVTTVLLLLFVILPSATALNEFRHAGKLQATTSFFLDLFIMHFFVVCAVAYFFYVGATLGSFLNVVAYRLPRQQTLLGSSSCPGCDTRIKMYHNQPIFGWFWLGGRCHNCKLKISIRYLIIECLAAAAIGSLALVELFCDGINLIEKPRLHLFVFEDMMINPSWVLIGYFLVHTCLLTILMTAALIRFQKDAVPRGLYLCGIVAATVLTILWPISIAFDIHGNASSLTPTIVNNLSTAMVGALVGLIAGCLFVPTMITQQSTAPWSHNYAFILIGFVLGWQSILLVALLCSLSHLNIRLLKQRLTPEHCLWIATTVAIIANRHWTELISG
jgi:leader peptidase (prepilin peptidase)/N-methyltransferase